MNFMKFLRTPVFIEHHRWLLLISVLNTGSKFNVHKTFGRRLYPRSCPWLNYVLYPEGYNCTSISLRKKCPYPELFWSVFSRIRTVYGEVPSISPYSVRMRKNTYQNNSEYGRFSRSIYYSLFIMIELFEPLDS